MSQAVIAHSPCLKKLQDEGFNLEVRGGYLFIHHMPYLNKQKQVCDGTLVMALQQHGLVADKPADHTAYWIGTEPCRIDGTVLRFINSPQRKHFDNGMVSDYYLSCCPDNGRYEDFHEKVQNYASLISLPAERTDNLAYKKICNLPAPSEHNDDSVFVYADSNSSRANITELGDVFKELKIGIIGLGGTGTYVLDKVAKTNVKEIHIFDDDILFNHNAFRAPGAISVDLLEKSPTKVEYFASEFSKMHRGITPHPVKISANNANLLDGLDFVFICVDSKSAREEIAAELLERRIPFIDSGIGATNSNGRILAVVRTTTSYDDKYNHLKHEFNSDGDSDDIYASNIQIAELNSLAADLAVIRWKRLCGYYADGVSDLNSIFSLDKNSIVNVIDGEC